MKRTSATLILVTVLATLMLAAAERVAPEGPISSNIRGLLPSETTSPVERAATTRFQNLLQRRRFILLEGTKKGQVFKAAAYLRKTAIRSGLYLDDAGSGSSRMARAARFLFPYRYGLLTAGQRQAITAGSGRDAVKNTLAAVYAPFAAFDAHLLLHDPFLIATRLLPKRAANVANGSMTVQNGFLTAQSGRHTAVLMVLRLKGSPFSARVEAAVAAQTARTDSLLASVYPGVRVSRAGVIEHSYRTAASVRKEVSTIGSLSIIGVVLLVVLVFRSSAPLIASLLTVAASVVGGFCAVIAAHGSINMISLVAGTSLIGISVDYAFHYFAELRYGQASGNAAEALAHIRPGIVLGFVTTLIAFVGMAVPPFPALRELALFSGSGITIAFACVWAIFPLFPLRRGPNRGIPAYTFIRQWLKVADAVDPRWAVYALLAGPAVCAVLLAYLLRPVDDVRALQPNNPDVTAAEQRLAAFAGAPLATQYLLVEGADGDQVLQREEALTPMLDKLVDSGRLGGFEAISQLVPSAASQHASLVAVSTLAHGHPAAIDRLSVALGLDPAVGDTFRSDLKATGVLTPSKVVDSGLFPDLAPLWLGRVASVTASVIALRSPVPAGAVRAVVKRHAGVRFVDPVSKIDALIQRYRSRVQWMMIGAYALILGMLAFRYGLRGALLAVMPPVAAALAALLALALTGQIYSVFATVGLILVLGIGIDYTLFFLENAGGAQATALAVILSAVSTLLAFGLLAFSATPAVHTFGLTIWIGVSVAFLLSPLARGGRTAGGRTTA